MSLKLNAHKWWECSGDELWAMNLRRPNFVSQDDECHRRGGNQALQKITPSLLVNVYHVWYRKSMRLLSPEMLSQLQELVLLFTYVARKFTSEKAIRSAPKWILLYMFVNESVKNSGWASAQTQLTNRRAHQQHQINVTQTSMGALSQSRTDKSYQS